MSRPKITDAHERALPHKDLWYQLSVVSLLRNNSAEANNIYFYHKAKPGDPSALHQMNSSNILPNAGHWAITRVCSRELTWALPGLNWPQRQTMPSCERSCCSICATKRLCVVPQLSGESLHGKNASSQAGSIGHKALAVALISLQLWTRFSSNPTAHLLYRTNILDNLIWANR